MLTKLPAFAAYVAQAAPSKRLQRAQRRAKGSEDAKAAAEKPAMEPVPEEDDEYVLL